MSDIAAINNGQDVIVNGNMYDNSKFYCAMLKLSNTGTIGWKHLSEGNTPGNKMFNLMASQLWAIAPYMWAMDQMKALSWQSSIQTAMDYAIRFPSM